MIFNRGLVNYPAWVDARIKETDGYIAQRLFDLINQNIPF